MENTSTPAESVEINSTKEVETSKVATMMKQSLFLYGAIVVALLFVVGAFLFTRGFIVAAMVNGSPISRLTVISELEKQGGKQALEAMISEKVVTTEFERLGITLGENEVSDEIKAIEEQIATQGGTLEQALTQQGMTMEILEDKIASQLKLEKALADKIEITDEEIATFVSENEIEIPGGKDGDALTKQIVDQIKQQKLQTEAATWIKEITDQASIKYYVTY